MGVAGTRGSVHRYTCTRGFTRLGPELVYCRAGRWSADTPPLCVSEYTRSRQLANFDIDIHNLEITLSAYLQFLGSFLTNHVRD